MANPPDPGMSKEEGNKEVELMPGFRFHPTEEELIEFYLRRKIQGKSFNVELISSLDLYSYDPWQLPAMAAIGEKEWYFYVPRDRKYRNGDRPNRVTISGYWKATGADRMIRNESLRSIGLKKTLVFYSGKAPKGLRTCWIMNEYRLPHSETDRFIKTEISLCRVYKRSGVVENRRLHTSKPSSLANSSSFSMLQEQNEMQKFDDQNQVIVQQQHELYPTSTNSLLQEDHSNKSSILHCPEVPMVTETVDELQRLVGYNNQSFVQQNNEIQQVETSNNYQLVHLNTVPVSLSTISEKLWEWNSLPSPSSKVQYFNNFQ